MPKLGEKNNDAYRAGQVMAMKLFGMKLDMKRMQSQDEHDKVMADIAKMSAETDRMKAEANQANALAEMTAKHNQRMAHRQMFERAAESEQLKERVGPPTQEDISFIDQAEAMRQRLGEMYPAALAQSAIGEDWTKLVPKQHKPSGYDVARRQGYKGSYMDYRKDIARAGSSRISIGTRETEKIKASIKSPRFRQNVINSVKSLHSVDWDLWDEPDKERAILEEMHKRIIAIWPNAYLAKEDGVYGWWDGDTLIRGLKE